MLSVPAARCSCPARAPPMPSPWGIRIAREAVCRPPRFPIPFLRWTMPSPCLRDERIAAGAAYACRRRSRRIALDARRSRRVVATRAGCSGCPRPDFGAARSSTNGSSAGCSARPHDGKGVVTVVRAFDWDTPCGTGFATAAAPLHALLEFANLSDRELSDIVGLHAQHAAGRTTRRLRFGPVLAYVFAVVARFIAAVRLRSPGRTRAAAAGRSREFGAPPRAVCRIPALQSRRAAAFRGPDVSIEIEVADAALDVAAMERADVRATRTPAQTAPAHLRRQPWQESHAWPSAVGEYAYLRR